LSSDLTIALQVAGKNASRNSVSALGTTLELLYAKKMDNHWFTGHTPRMDEI